ncbi:D-amino-acid transaminase [Methylophaga sp.]|uniref:D-amino-acid transaminase n=1 Tax=Methylophaga sp. TaxID=2024840 RepID=UPI0013FF885E|nr:D-amino-acid transaminase [Methylophaga sp.]MTI64520.1 D-amino-acid transaminase [Methylophaga sp.]
MRTVFLNGEYLPADQARVSVLDRGFLLGDGVYEVIPVYQGLPFCLKEHLQRLQRSLDGVRMANPYSLDEWSEIIARLVKENDGDNQAVYLQVTRGVAPRDHVFPEGVEPTAFVMTNPIKPLPAWYKQEGIKAITVNDIRWAQCDIKAITLLPNSLLRQQAQDVGAQEAILIRDGYMTEGSASNSYAVLDGVIYTAPKDEKVLPGITRDVVLALAQAANIPYREQAVSAEQLKQADEIWISSSTRELLPVTSLDGAPVGGGKPGPVWQQLDALYQRRKTEGSV